MKLNSRNNIVLISLVIFQAFLAYNFLTISLGTFSQREGDSIIDNDIETIKNHYDKFKSGMWEDVTHLDNRLPGLIDSSRTMELEQLIPLIMGLIGSEDLDYIIVEQGGSRSGLSVKRPFASIPFERLPFDQGLWHPKLSLQSRDSTLYMVASLQVERYPEDAEPYTINLLREVNDRFSKDLTYNTSAGIIIYSGDTAFAGTLDPAYYFKGVRELKGGEPQGLRFYDQLFYQKSYNLLFSPLDTLIDNTTEVSLVLFSPNLSIKQRFSSIRRQFLFISIICVFLAMGISLIISRSISRPVQRLGGAMAELTRGLYPSVEPKNTATEITQLFEDFNSMVSRMQYNATQQIAMIQEISFLKSYNEQIVESIQEGIAIIDKTGHLNLMNRSFYSFFPELKEAEVPHVSLISFWDQRLQENLELVRTRSRKNYSDTGRDTNGRLYDVKLYPLRDTGYDRSTVGSTILMLEDITAKERLEAQLLQVEKLSSLSILTAGVAHEINNPLASIMANVENLRIDKEDEESRTSLLWIRREISRIAGIIKGLLSFTGSYREGESSIEQEGHWQERIDMYMRYALRQHSKISFKSTIEPGLPALAIPEDQLLQVLINLLNNSLGAIEESGTIELKARRAQGDENQVLLEIIDDGQGISDQIVHKIFDPFYTTKPVGKGTGLGLSIVYGLVNRYGGTITLDSTVGEGTRFTLTIPLR